MSRLNNFSLSKLNKTIKYLEALAISASANIETYPPTLSSLRILGSTVKGQSLGVEVTDVTLNSPLTDSRMHIIPIEIYEAGTISSLTYWQGAQGVFTSESNNQVGIYSASGGILTKLGESADNTNLWKAGANSFHTESFSSSISVEKGLYYAALLYNTSSQTTAPTIGAAPNAVHVDFSAFGLPNSGKLYALKPTVSSLPASVPFSEFSSTNLRWYVAII